MVSGKCEWPCRHAGVSVGGTLAVPSTRYFLGAGSASAILHLDGEPSRDHSRFPPPPLPFNSCEISHCCLNGTTGKRRNQYYTNCFLIQGPSNFQ